MVFSLNLHQNITNTNENTFRKDSKVDIEIKSPSWIFCFQNLLSINKKKKMNFIMTIHIVKPNGYIFWIYWFKIFLRLEIIFKIVAKMVFIHFWKTMKFSKTSVRLQRVTTSIIVIFLRVTYSNNNNSNNSNLEKVS